MKTMTTKTTKISKYLKNEIHKFLDMEEMIQIKYSCKNSKIAFEFNRNLELYYKLRLELKKKKIGTIYELFNDIELLEKVSNNEDVFYEIFNHLIKNKEYFFVFGNSIEGLIDKNKLKYETILHSLKRNRNVEKLHIKNMGIFNDDERKFYFPMIINVIKENKCLTYINLFQNQLGKDYEEIKLISEVLENNYSIKIVRLSDNLIGSSENMAVISKALKKNKYLKKIYLDKNHIGDDLQSMKSLASGIQGNKSINCLNIENNRLGSNIENLYSLKEGFDINQSLTEIYLFGNGIGSNRNYKNIFVNDRIKFIYSQDKTL